ncbi:MAG: ankyrin repeat domain-containing protein [Methanobacteriota archaeon]
MVPAVFDAIKAGDLAKVQRILRADPTIANARGPDGVPAVVFALYHGRKDIADAILAHKPVLDAHAAATVGDLARVRELVEKDPRGVHAFSADGFPPLGLAAYMGHADVVRYLLSKGADVNQIGKNPAKFTALTGAVAARHLDVVRILVEAGADPNYWYGGGYTPVLEAAAHGDIPMLELLVAHGGDVTAETEQGATAVSLASEGGHQDAAEWLRKHGAK